MLKKKQPSSTSNCGHDVSLMLQWPAPDCAEKPSNNKVVDRKTSNRNFQSRRLHRVLVSLFMFYGMKQRCQLFNQESLFGCRKIRPSKEKPTKKVIKQQHSTHRAGLFLSFFFVTKRSNRSWLVV